MPQLVDEITVLNRALARIGAGSVQDRDEDSDLARQVFAVFDDSVEFFLDNWNWSWCREARRLERFDGTPVNGWSYVYNIPPDALAGPEYLLVSQRRDDVLREFSVEAGKIYCNRDAVWGGFLIRRSMEQWPPAVRTSFTVYLASEFCIPVTHDDDLAAKLRMVAVGSPQEDMSGGMVGRALRNDVMRSGPLMPVQDDNPLTQAHYAGPGAASGNWWG